MKMLSRPDGFMFNSKLGIDFFSVSELLYSNLQFRVRPIRAKPKFYMFINNPNFTLGNVDFSPCNRRSALHDDCYKDTIDMLAYTPVEINYLELLHRLL